MSDTRRVRVFLNHRSGVGDLHPETLREQFAAHDCPCEITFLERHLNLPALAQSDSPDLIWVAAGGDGTVNCLANALAGTSRRLGVLPVGTLNHFAQDLGVPLTLPAAIEVIATGSSRTIDTANVNGVTFVNNSSLGVYPAMVLDRERMKKGGLNKWGSLVVACTRAFIRFRHLHVELEIHGETRRCTTPLLFVGNNVYCMEGGNFGRRNRLDEGTLSLFLVPSATRTTMLRLLVAALFGRVHAVSELEEVTLERFTVRAHHRRLRVSFDGEVKRMPPPLRYATRPASLNVLIPRKDPA